MGRQAIRLFVPVRKVAAAEVIVQGVCRDLCDEPVRTAGIERGQQLLTCQSKAQDLRHGGFIACGQGQVLTS
jgi:hypothetical protein